MPMRSEIPEDPTPPPGHGEDVARRAHGPHEAAPGSRPARADDLPEYVPPGAGLPPADPPEGEQVFRATFERAVIGIAHFSPGGAGCASTSGSATCWATAARNSRR